MSNKKGAKNKEGLRGFARGWVIFHIVNAAAAALANASYLNHRAVGGIVGLSMLYCGVAIVGLSLLLKKKAYGLWILLAGSLLIMTLSGTRVGSYFIIASGGLVMTGITWIVTSRQIRYFGGRKPDTAPQTEKGVQVSVMPSYTKEPVVFPGADAAGTQMSPVSGKVDEASGTTMSEPVCNQGPVAGPVPESVPQFSAAPFYSEEPERNQSGAGKRVSTPIIIGIGTFAVVFGGLLLLLISRPHQGASSAISTTTDPAQIVAVTSSSARLQPTGDTQRVFSTSPATNTQPAGDTETAVTTSPPAITRPPSDVERAFAAELESRLPDALRAMADMGNNNDPVLLQAISQAKLVSVTFHDGQADVSFSLPDPTAASLDQLGIAQYIPYSGAQAYIRDNYARLCDMGRVTSLVLLEATLLPREDIDGSLTIDWNLYGLSLVFTEYEQIFKSHVEEYMMNKGFHTAALELLMPDFQSWDRHMGEAQDLSRLEGYFQSLAEALSLKGIELNGKIVVDVETIKQTLETRFVKIWVFDSPEFTSHNQTTTLKVRSINETMVFQPTCDELSAQFKAGTKPVPADVSALDVMFLAYARDKFNALFKEDGLFGPDSAYDRRYEFTWADLGEKGTAGCTDLVEDVRDYLHSYDFFLMFLASWTETK
ncbi:MAG: hypothetical protein QM270_11355 [Bacillota bacterium]|nr:hypothetical protein [Bacillota bacterium]